MKEKIRQGKLDTYVGDKTSFEGKLISEENLRIHGNVKGTIECQGLVVIGKSGNVEADILANDVVINGKVIGNVIAKGKLEMASTGVIQGDIKTSRFVMEDGGKFDGNCEMLPDGKSAAVEKTKTVDETPAITPKKEKLKLPGVSHK